MVAGVIPEGKVVNFLITLDPFLTQQQPIKKWCIEITEYENIDMWMFPRAEHSIAPNAPDLRTVASSPAQAADVPRFEPTTDQSRQNLFFYGFRTTIFSKGVKGQGCQGVVSCSSCLNIVETN